MGFNFSRGGGAGGGGGGIKREFPDRQNSGNIGIFPATALTSPQWILNNSFSIAFSTSNAWTYTSSYGVSSLSLSFGSTYWVDLMYILAQPYGATFNITLNGNMLTPPRVTSGRDVLAFDVYGYGLSCTIDFDTTGTVHMAPAIARTVITSGGSIVWPPALSGQSVLRDI